MKSLYRISRTFMIACAGLVALVLSVASAPCAGQATQPFPARVLDRFDDLALWKAAASDGVNAVIGYSFTPSTSNTQTDVRIGMRHSF